MAEDKTTEKLKIIKAIFDHILDPKVLPWVLLLLMTNVGQAISSGLASKFLGIEIKKNDPAVCCTTVNAMAGSNAELQKLLTKCHQNRD